MSKDLEHLADRIYNEHLGVKNLRENREQALEAAYAAGMIRKSDYVVGQTYLGTCRNASEAIWDGERFAYERYKWGSTFTDHVECPEDDRGYDIFVPVAVKS